MAKYQITRSCGCEETVNICGPVRHRQGKADWEASRMCKECYKKSIAEENEKSGLPTLEGSPKQVSWAESIRNNSISNIKAKIDYMDEIIGNPEDHEPTETSTKWMIENRF